MHHPARRRRFTTVWLLRFVLCASLPSIRSPVYAGFPESSNPPPSKTDDVLATLGDIKIRQSDFDRFLEAGYGRDEVTRIHENPVIREEALEEYLDLRVMAAKARKDRIDQTPAFQKAQELMELKILAKHVADLDRNRMTAPTTTDEEILDYYKSHQDLFQVTPGFTARQLLVYVKGNPAFPEKGLDAAEAEVKTREALAKLRAGETWEKIAKLYSDDIATSQRSGLMEDAQFGYFPPEVEAAVRQQELCKPGDVIRSQFGYHILQVEKRTFEGAREPFDKVKEIIAHRIITEKLSAARQNYINQLRAEVGLKETAAARIEASLINGATIDPNEIIATLAGTVIREEDFQWFIKDAYRPEQRTYVFSRPGARREMLASYLEMRAMEAKARKENFDKDPSFEITRAVMEMKLLAEFLEERDKVSPWSQPSATDEERVAALKTYTNRLRAEMGLKIGSFISG